MEHATRKYAPKSVRLMDQVPEVLHFHHSAYNAENPVPTRFSVYSVFPIKNT